MLSEHVLVAFRHCSAVMTMDTHVRCTAAQRSTPPPAPPATSTRPAKRSFDVAFLVAPDENLLRRQQLQQEQQQQYRYFKLPPHLATLTFSLWDPH